MNIVGLLALLGLAVEWAAVLFGYTPYPWVTRGETFEVGIVVFAVAWLAYRIDRAARKP